jgi:hypothetical protein
MKIEIDFEDTSAVKITIGDRVVVVKDTQFGCSLKGVPAGLHEDSLGGIIARALFSKVHDIAQVLEEHDEWAERPWEILPVEIAEDAYDRIG